MNKLKNLKYCYRLYCFVLCVDFFVCTKAAKLLVISKHFIDYNQEYNVYG